MTKEERRQQREARRQQRQANRTGANSAVQSSEVEQSDGLTSSTTVNTGKAQNTDVNVPFVSPFTPSNDGPGTRAAMAQQSSEENTQRLRMQNVPTGLNPDGSYASTEVGSGVFAQNSYRLKGKPIPTEVGSGVMRQNTANNRRLVGERNVTIPLESEDDGASQQRAVTIADIYKLYDDDLAQKQAELLEAKTEDARMREVERKSVTIAAIGDLLSSFTNLIGTGLGATNQVQTYATPGVGSAILNAQKLRKSNMQLLNTQIANDRKQMLTARINELAAMNKADRVSATQANTALGWAKFEYKKQMDPTLNSYKDRALDIQQQRQDTYAKSVAKSGGGSASAAFAENRETRAQETHDAKKIQQQQSDSLPTALNDLVESYFPGRTLNEVLSDMNLILDPRVQELKQIQSIVNSGSEEKRATKYRDIMSKLGKPVSTGATTASTSKPSGSSSKGSGSSSSKPKKHIWE